MRRMSIGSLIKAGRKALEMTEQRFSDAVGVSRGAVQQWEKDETAPSRKHQPAVAKLIGISVGELMSGVSARYPTQTTTDMPAEDLRGSYQPDLFAEARHLLTQMSPAGRQEALQYMRYLTKRHPADFSTGAADSTGDTLPPRAKAA